MLQFTVTTYFVSTRIYVSIKAMAPVHPISAKGLILGSKSLLSPGTMWQTLEKKQCYDISISLSQNWETMDHCVIYIMFDTYYYVNQSTERADRAKMF